MLSYFFRFTSTLVLIATLTMAACQLAATPALPVSSSRNLTATPGTANAGAQIESAVPSPTATQLSIVTDSTSTPQIAGATPGDDALGSIIGWVWHDVCEVGQHGQPAPANAPVGCVADGTSYRANGVKDFGEPALSDVRVKLGAGACPSTGLAETTTLAGDISYAFTGLSAGMYCVSVDPLDTANAAILLPGMWTYPAVEVGSQTIELKAGENKFEMNFGWDYQFLPNTTGGFSDSACTYKATFIADVTVPDYTVFAPGAAFVKTWRVRNDGTCAWGSASQALSSLVFVGGHPLGAPEGVTLPAEVLPGGEADISIAMQAPSASGAYRSEWKLAGTGLLVGVGANDAPLYAQIVVGGDSAYRATPVAESPAAGICASFEGNLVEIQISADVPDPRCVQIRAAQKLMLRNSTPKMVEFTLGQFTAQIEPGQTYTLNLPLGDYLALGIHRVHVSTYSAPELWLES